MLSSTHVCGRIHQVVCGELVLKITDTEGEKFPLRRRQGPKAQATTLGKVPDLYRT